jgi:hypothetical protein
MKTKKSLVITALSLATALAILSPSAFAAQPIPLNLQMGGIITNAGNQHYVISSGYHAAAGMVGDVPLSSAQAKYSLDASVVGLSTFGTASLDLKAGSQSLHADIFIIDEMPAAVFPLDSAFGNCVTNCNSEIPLMFLGFASITIPGASPFILPVGIESAYWNPFGGPIVITSLESDTPFLTLLVTYNVATIDWTGVQLQGILGGAFGSEGVTGYYILTSNSHENLVVGNEQDSGTIAFAGIAVNALNAAGSYSGTTKFSLAGSVDCSTLTGLPEGTCTATGATSNGVFHMNGATGLKLIGSFSTMWSVPSLTTITTVSANVV